MATKLNEVYERLTPESWTQGTTGAPGQPRCLIGHIIGVYEFDTHPSMLTISQDADANDDVLALAEVIEKVDPFLWKMTKGTRPHVTPEFCHHVIAAFNDSHRLDEVRAVTYSALQARMAEPKPEPQPVPVPALAPVLAIAT